MPFSWKCIKCLALIDQFSVNPCNFWWVKTVQKSKLIASRLQIQTILQFWQISCKNWISELIKVERYWTNCFNLFIFLALYTIWVCVISRHYFQMLQFLLFVIFFPNLCIKLFISQLLNLFSIRFWIWIRFTFDNNFVDILPDQG